MRVVMTRPTSDATAWQEALQAAGHQTLLLPLIDIRPAPESEPLQQAWGLWPTWQAVMFVSAQAVRYFFQSQPTALGDGHGETGSAWSAAHLIGATGPRCWATGPGTHKALLQAGVPEACIDSPAMDVDQFDSEALWRRVSSQVHAGQSVLIVRGSDAFSPNLAQKGAGRHWLAQQIEAAEASVHFVVAYVRQAPAWTAAQKAQAAQAADDASVWCFSSSQAIEHLAQLLPAQNWAQARCIATHSRIAQTARALGFGEIHTARPSVADVLGSLESLA